MKKGHLKTDCNGSTRTDGGDNCIFLNVSGDRFFDLKPDTDYTLIVTEGKPGAGKCLYCPQCGQSVKAHIPEPAIPEGYRVLEPWEVEVSNFLQKRPEVYYRRPRNAIYPQEWERRIMCVKKNWDVHNSEYAVPADWSPLPKCRDCGGRTELLVDDLAGCREYQIICDASGNRCTSGPLKSTKAEAVKAYPI